MDIEVKPNPGCVPIFSLVSGDQEVLRYLCRKKRQSKSHILRPRDPARAQAIQPGDVIADVSRTTMFSGDLEVAFVNDPKTQEMTVATSHIATESMELSSRATTPLVPPKRRFNVKVSPWWQSGRMYFSVNGHKILFVLQRGVLSPGRFEVRLLYPNYPAPGSGVAPVAGTHYTLLLTYTERGGCGIVCMCCCCCRRQGGRKIWFDSAMARSMLECRAPAFHEVATTQVPHGAGAKSWIQSSPMWLDRSTDYTVSGLSNDELKQVLLALSVSFVEVINGRILVMAYVYIGVVTLIGAVLRLTFGNTMHS
ncbi:hypothetical protein RI367_007232 [Sorochytrium milnesiophthora]